MTDPKQSAFEELTPDITMMLREAFGEQPAQLLRLYATWLTTAGITRGLVGPRESPRIWQRHILNCAAVAELIPAGSRVVDVGSGAGLPGIVLACVDPSVTVQLVEPLSRRTTFLCEVIDDLGLRARVEVVRGRVTDPVVRRRVIGAQVVTARAVAHLGLLGEWLRPATRAGAQVLALKGHTAAKELSEHCDRLQQLAFDILGVAELQPDYLQEPVRVVRLQRRSD